MAYRSNLIWLLVLITLWRLGAVFFLPVTQDEAYYFDWAHHLAWGYFDHPPGVALLGLGALLAPGSAFAARLGTLIAATLLLIVLVRFYRACHLGNPRVLVAAVALACLSFPGLGVGLIATPDTPLALCWVLALQEALLALRGARHRWLTAGIATGLGLLSKYTMVLIGPVFLWAILWADRRALRTPWPYLGCLVAILIFSPHLLWNAQNDWVTMGFQLGHGLGPLVDSGSIAHPPAPPRAFSDRLASLGAYLGTQALLWGFFLVPIIRAFLKKPERGTLAGLDRPARALLISGTLFPLLFFAPIALFSSVEPNWPGPYLATAAPLVALALKKISLRWIGWAGGGNLLLASLLVYQGATAALPTPDAWNRILRETQGFRALARAVAPLSGPIFGDRYQLIALMRFYAHEIRIGQWPTWTRPSEYLRGELVPRITPEEIARAGGFWLLLSQPITPSLGGYERRTLQDWIDCPGQPLSPVQTCARPIHHWRLIRYVPAE